MTIPEEIKTLIENKNEPIKKIDSLFHKYGKKCVKLVIESKDVSMKLIPRYQILSEDFIRAFQNELCWNEISECQQLSENFIDEFSDMVDWWNISAYQCLSEPFIEKHKNKVCWIPISRYQSLSQRFIQIFREYLFADFVLKYQSVESKELRKYFKSKRLLN